MELGKALRAVAIITIIDGLSASDQPVTWRLNDAAEFRDGHTFMVQGAREGLTYVRLRSCRHASPSLLISST